MTDKILVTNNWVELLQLGLFETTQIQTMKQNYYIVVYDTTITITNNKITKNTATVMIKDKDDNLVSMWHPPSTIRLQIEHFGSNGSLIE